ncbi:MAG: hypothetical protein H7296_00140 [Bacteroidia bacterium]|nr:hypothetical protein [Bacteroidia bacterium]
MKTALPIERSISGIFQPLPNFSTRQKLVYQLHQSTKQLLDFAKFSYLAIVMILLLCTVIELKHIFNVDIFPGIDTPFDNAYYAGKEQIGNNTL